MGMNLPFASGNGWVVMGPHPMVVSISVAPCWVDFWPRMRRTRKTRKPYFMRKYIFFLLFDQTQVCRWSWHCICNSLGNSKNGKTHFRCRVVRIRGNRAYSCCRTLCHWWVQGRAFDCNLLDFGRYFLFLRHWPR